MDLQVIGAGLGRTGTYSLKLALSQLGLGPCHHMEDVLQNVPAQVPLWSAAVHGNPDWPAIYRGCESAVDWPTAAFFPELLKEYPSAKFILTHRSPESWLASFGSTIYKVLAGKDAAPIEMKGWFEMLDEVLAKTGFRGGCNEDDLMNNFVTHNETVKATIPADQLLVFEVQDGWEPLCKFLGVPAPDEPFPRSNNREEFWDLAPGSP